MMQAGGQAAGGGYAGPGQLGQAAGGGYAGPGLLGQAAGGGYAGPGLLGQAAGGGYAGQAQQGLAVAVNEASQLTDPFATMDLEAMVNGVGPVGGQSEPFIAMLDAPVPPSDPRKRAASSAAPDKALERRQRKKLKDRETSSRWRARKKVYVRELEIKVSRQEEEIQTLKKGKVEMMMRPPELRRTSSAPF